MIRRWDIWYWKREYATKALLGDLRPTLNTLDESHIYLRHVQAENVEEVFKYMQAELWSPKGEARPIIESLGLTHTSMSVGDVAHDIVNGKWWRCANEGWEEVKENT
jgi:hypothetical protein